MPGYYIVEYCTGVTSVYNRTADDYVYTYHYYAAGFTVVATPPTLPPAGNAAFSWQGSVAGVNTGNGNKTTVVPVTGWTMRGGMKASCALYHNSQGPLYGGYGSKWLVSYFTYLYASGSNLIIHWDNGLTYMFTANADGSWTAPIGILDKLSYSNGVYKLTTPNQTVYTFGYGSGPVYLSSIKDKDGNTLSIGHNPDTTISGISDQTGRGITYAYSGGQLVTIYDSLGHVFALFYNGSDLIQVTSSVLNGVYYANPGIGYDGNHDITSLKNARGYASTFFYDGLNRLSWAKDPYGNQTTFTYNANNTVITDPNGHTATHTYAYSRLSTVTDALGLATYYNYDVDNILNSTQDRRGQPWSSSSHFSNGSNISTSADPCGDTTSTTYDTNNNPSQSKDPFGNVTTYGYTNQDLTSTSITGTGTAPFKATSAIGGYANGLPTTFTDPLLHPSSVGYDGNGYVNSVVDTAKDPASTAVYDIMGFKLSSTDANGHTTTYTPDNWERVTDVQAPDLTHTSTIYDADGNITSITDANNNTVKNEYDADDRLTKTTNGRGDVVKYTYDGPNGYGSLDRNGFTQKGLLSSKTDGNGHTTYYSYTVRNEPFATYYADGTSESVGYDNNGNTTSRLKPDGSTIGYTYDNANRLTDITYLHLPPTHFDYDADGRKNHMHDGTGDTYWSYLNDGVHLCREANIQGTVDYLYDGDGRRSQMTLAGQSAPWTYGYDLNGRLSTLQSPTDGKTTYTYDGAGGPGTKDANGYTQYGLLSRKTKGSGEFDTYTYDLCNEVLTIGYNWADGTYHDGLVYGYDPAGNVKTKSENGTPTTYGYDGADQLTSETIGSTIYGYTFDGNGNRLTQTANGAAFQSFTYDAHDKANGGTQGNETDTWDKDGNEKSVFINGNTYTFTYDDEDRLTKLVTPTATDTYTYNGLGLRVGKTDSTGSYSYATDGTSPGSSVLADGHALYTPGLSENRNGTSAFYSFDRLGNLWTADGTGKSALNTVDYSAFGLTLAGSAGTEVNPSVHTTR